MSNPPKNLGRGLTLLLTRSLGALGPPNINELNALSSTTDAKEQGEFECTLPIKLVGVCGIGLPS